MNLVRFLVIASILSIILGEFGKYPFGNVGSSINILDILVALTGGFFLIWKIGISKKFDFPRIFWFVLLFIGIGTISLLVNLNFTGGLYLARFSLYGLFFWIAYSLRSENSDHFFQVQKFLVGVGVLLSMLGFIQLIFLCMPMFPETRR